MSMNGRTKCFPDTAVVCVRTTPLRKMPSEKLLGINEVKKNKIIFTAAI